MKNDEIYWTGVSINSAGIFRGFVKETGPDLFEAFVEDEEFKLKSLGTFDSPFEACARFRAFAANMASKVNLLWKFTKPGTKFFVCREGSKWSIVAGIPPGKFEDTGLRFDNQDSARRYLEEN